MNYYIVNKQNQSEGPYTIEQLRQLGITESTKVYGTGLTGWTPASEVPGLKEQLFGQVLPATPVPPPPVKPEPVPVAAPVPPPVKAEPVPVAAPVPPAPVKTEPVPVAAPVPPAPVKAEPVPAAAPVPPAPVKAEPVQAKPVYKQPVQPKKSSNTWLWILLGGIGLLVIVGIIIAVFALSGDSKDTEETVYTEHVSEVQNEPVAVQNSGWEKYRWLQSRYATEEDLQGMTSSELCIMRNFIFAYHNYIFKRDDLKNYFSQFPEYTPLYSNVSHDLNSIEQANVEFIKWHE